MDDDAGDSYRGRYSVATCVGMTSALGGSWGFLAALTRGGSIPAMTMTTAVSWGVLGIPFFGLREFFVRKIHRDDAAASFLAGGFTGYFVTLLSTYPPRAKPIVQGGFRLALVAGISHLLYDQIRSNVDGEQIRLWMVDTRRIISDRYNDPDIPLIPWPRWLPVQKPLDYEYEKLKMQKTILEGLIDEEKERIARARSRASQDEQ